MQQFLARKTKWTFSWYLNHFQGRRLWYTLCRCKSNYINIIFDGKKKDFLKTFLENVSNFFNFSIWKVKRWRKKLEVSVKSMQDLEKMSVNYEQCFIQLSLFFCDTHSIRWILDPNQKRSCMTLETSKEWLMLLLQQLHPLLLISKHGKSNLQIFIWLLQWNFGAKIQMFVPT